MPPEHPGQRKRRLRLPVGSHSIDRNAFWRFCVSATHGAQERARLKNLAFDLSPDAIDRLLVDQRWRCAVSEIPLENPSINGGNEISPFGPSIDRIRPELGYVNGKVRVVCNIVNAALGHWGMPALLRLQSALSTKFG